MTGHRAPAPPDWPYEWHPDDWDLPVTNPADSDYAEILADFPEDGPAAPHVERVTAVQAARTRIRALTHAALAAAEQAGMAAAALERADADLAFGRGTRTAYDTAHADTVTTRAALDAAEAELTAAIGEALTFGPLAEQDALPARPVTPPRLAWEDRTVADDLAAEAADARTEALR